MTESEKEDLIRQLAYEYWEKSGRRSSSEENWTKAEKQLRPHKVSFREGIEKALESLKSYSELAGRLLPIFTLLSTVLTVAGPVLLGSYLNQVQAPFPTPDSSLVLLVVLLAVAGAGLLVYVPMLCVSPFPLVRSDKVLHKLHRTFFFAWPWSGHGREYLRQYGRYFFPYLISMAALLGTIGVAAAGVWWWIIPLLVFWVAMLSLGFRSVKGKVTTPVWVQGNIFSIACSLAEFNICLVLLPTSIGWTKVIAITAGVVILHAALNALISDNFTLVMFVLSSALFLVYLFGLGSVAAGALRVFGWGGGVPIDISFKSRTPFSACLILATGSELIVTERGPKDTRCQSVSPRAILPWPVQREKRPIAITFERSDVASIEGVRAVSTQAGK